MQVRYREATPPNEQLVVRSSVVSIKENNEKIGGGKPSVQVDITLHKVICCPLQGRSLLRLNWHAVTPNGWAMIAAW